MRLIAFRTALGIAGLSVPAPYLISIGIAGAAIAGALWWVRNHRLNTQRRTMHAFNALGEEIMASASAAEMAKKLSARMPSISGATTIRMYLYNRKTRLLERVPTSFDQQPISINPESPSGALPTGIALAFRNRVLLSVPDTRRSPLFDVSSPSKAVVFVPMLAQNELLGVIELEHDGGGDFGPDEQAAVQHLANEAALSLKLQEQQSLHEQLVSSEKLAATGQLISGVAHELRAPLENILTVSKRLLTRTDAAPFERELRILGAEGRRASDIVARLVSYSRAEETETRAVELNGLLSNLMRFREREWKSLGIDVHSRLSAEPLYVNGVQGQLEQAFLNMLVHAEQSALEAAGEKVINVVSGAVARRILIEITYSCSESTHDPFAQRGTNQPHGFGLGVWRTMIHAHGGETRFSRPNAQTALLIVDVPLKVETRATSRPAAPKRTHPLTTLVVEPDAVFARRIVKDLSGREHRAVPVGSAEEGFDLIQRIRFDIVLCSSKLPGMSWGDFVQRIGGQVGAFILLADRVDSGPRPMMLTGQAFVIHRPAYDLELNRILTAVESGASDQGAVRANR
jgi:signal transduction histidine kinase